MKCKKGKKLLHEWANQVKNASMNEWQSIMFGKREYDKHAKRCKICKGTMK